MVDKPKQIITRLVQFRQKVKIFFYTLISPFTFQQNNAALLTFTPTPQKRPEVLPSGRRRF
jgi:hypothetical protein